MRLRPVNLRTLGEGVAILVYMRAASDESVGGVASATQG